MGEVVYEIGPGHGDPGYNTIAAWEAATDIDIVASGSASGEGVIIVGELMVAQSGYDEDGLTFAGAVTDASNYRVLRAKSTVKHTGRRGTGAVIYSDLGGFAGTVDIQENFFKLEDVEIQSDGSAVQYGVVVNSANSGVDLSGVIVYEHAYGGVYHQGSGTATNCIVHHTASTPTTLGAFQGDSSDSTKLTCRHCSALAETTDNNKDVTGFRYLVAHNCISMHYGGTAGHKDFLNLGHGSQNNCSSDDSADDWTSPGLPTQTATDVFQNVTSGSSTDLHIKETSPVVGSGSGISAVPTDIDGDAWGSPPSIGADEYIGSFTGTIVYDTDADLVALYRFENFVSDGYLSNRSLAPAWSGYNNMDTSGTPVQADHVPALLPSGSGAQFDNFSDAFHVHVSGGGGTVPQSGLEVDSNTAFSFGFWGKISGVFDNDRSWFTKWSSATSGAYYRLQASSGTGGTNMHWSLTLGTSNGTSSAAIENTSLVSSIGNYEFVCATVDPSASTAILYVSGLPVASSVALSFSPGPSGVDIIDVPIRLGAHRSFSSMGLTNAIGGDSGLMANAFFLRRALTQLEVSGIYQSGFASGSAPEIPVSGMSNSDLNDTLKDNIGAQSSSGSTMIITAWDVTDPADPSGYRHMTSGLHPAFIKVLGQGSTSGLSFGNLLQTTSSGTKAIVFRNATSGNNVDNMRFWLKDYGAFPSSGWNVAVHVNSKWLPNLILPSGSGILGKSLGDAVTVLRSDGATSISGYELDGTSSSGEQEVSQYIYIAFNADTELAPATYGYDDFGFHLTLDNA